MKTYFNFLQEGKVKGCRSWSFYNEKKDKYNSEGGECCCCDSQQSVWIEYDDKKVK